MRGLLLVALIHPAHADTGEIALRPSLEVRHADASSPSGAAVPASALGAALGLAYGIDFSWSLSARYGYDTTGELEKATAEGTELEVWRQARHALLLGAAWAPWDEWTPIGRVELGAATQRGPARAHPDPER